METGSAHTVIECSPAVAFDAVADITRMGEWSPECTAGRWIGGASGPAVGAEFEGDNIVKIGPITAKQWTTTSKVTVCEPGVVFEFVAEDYTTWRFDFAPHADGVTVTESFSFRPYEGWQKLVYGMIMQRTAGITKGMQQTLARLKAALEA